MKNAVLVVGLAVCGQLTAGTCVMESARKIPLVKEADVLVVGGSSGAVSAALAAKSAGASVYLVAPRPYLGEDIAGALSLPEHYGRNLDAFYDVLTEYGGNWKIVFKHAGAVARGLRAVCADAMAETPGLEIMFEP